MAIAPPSQSATLLTYEDYLAEGEICKRYDILDGVRSYMTNPTRRHQSLVGNLHLGFHAYQRKARNGRVILSPCDVLIMRTPLRTRQPDILYISKARLVQNPPEDDPAPLEPAPELVVEILSQNENRRERANKIADYQKAGVLECWVVDQDRQSVEVLALMPQRIDNVFLYGPGDMVQSVVFPGLKVSVAQIFAE